MTRQNSDRMDTSASLCHEEPRTPSFPNRVTVEFTNACNLKCGMCPRNFMEARSGYMAWELYTKLIDEMAEYPGTALVPFFRGESMLHPKFEAMLAYVKEKGVGPIQFTTNATRMTQGFARALVDLEIDFVSFSVDSIDPEKYATIRVNGDLKETLANIEYFCAYKAEQESSLPEVQVSLVKTAQTEDSIEAFVKYWRAKVDRVRIYEEHSTDGTFGALKRDSCNPGTERLACHKPFGDMVIYWDGSVALCNHDWVRTDPIANAKDQTIAQVWLSERYDQIRKAHLGDTNELETVCKGCDHWRMYYQPKQLIGDLYETEFDI